MSSLLAILMKYLIGLVGITLVVVVHEIGHLIAARINGIEVEIFSFGIGPKLWGILYKGTEYRISLFPLGGYCRLKGSDDLNQALLHNNNQFTHTEEGSLFSVHPRKRIWTYLAGPFANLLFAIVLYALLATFPTKVLSTECRVATINEYPTLFGQNTSPAYDAGIRTGDLVIELDSKPIPDWETLQSELSASKGTQTFTVIRESSQLDFTVVGERTEQGSYRYGLTVLEEPVVGNVRPNTPEAKIGLLSGDRIIEAQEKAISNQLDLMAALANPSESVTLQVLRDSTQYNLSFAPSLDMYGNPTYSFSLKSGTKQGKPVPFSLVEGWNQAFLIAKESITSVQSLWKNKDNDVSSSVTGMARSALLIGDITTLGFEQDVPSGMHALIYLMGVVSISLALANLLPLPAFDGGQMLIALWEIITKKQIRPKTYYHLQLFGLGCVFLIFLFLTMADLNHFLSLKR